MENEKEIKKGLGGWLIIVGISLILSPFVLIFKCYSVFTPIFADNTIQVLTDQNSPSYHPFWGPYLYGELIFNLLLVIGSIYLIFLFFKKMSYFPKYFIIFVVLNLLFLFIDAILIKIVLPNEVIFDVETLKEIIRQFIYASIWIPYMIFSKRVKVTFIN